MLTSSCGLGFAHDVDTQVARARAVRFQLATNGISTVCSGYEQSSTHSCLKYRRPRNSEAHLDRPLPDARVLLVLLTVFETYLAGIWAV